MTVIENTLRTVIERQDDPGDYPSNAGSAPLPSRDVVAEVTGHVVVILAVEEMEDITQLYGDSATDAALVREYFSDLPPESVEHDTSGVRVRAWRVKDVSLPKVTLTVAKFQEE